MAAKVVVGAAMPEDQPVLPSVEDLALQCCSGVDGDNSPPSHEPYDNDIAPDDGDRDERLAIMEIDGELDLARVTD